MKSFQKPDNRVYGVGMQKKILGLLIKDKKIFVEKTQNQERMILLCRELDRSYRI